MSDEREPADFDAGYRQGGRDERRRCLQLVEAAADAVDAAHTLSKKTASDLLRELAEDVLAGTQQLPPS